jgi:ABC-type transporter Mla maintaining outer membrane lipid asymmetry ATPase subunit MlaF
MERDVTKLPLKELNEVRKKGGFLFQQAALYDSLTIKENVGFPCAAIPECPTRKVVSACESSSPALEWKKSLTNCPANSLVECKNAWAWRGPWHWSRKFPL